MSDSASVTTEDFISALQLMNNERVRRYYEKHREEILKKRHMAYFQKKKIRKIPARQPYSNVKYLKSIEEDGETSD